MAAEIRNMIVIGSGPSGLTAAIYAARAGLNPLVLCGTRPGGQLTGTTNVENFPGFAKVLGPRLMNEMQAQAKLCGAELVYQNAETIDAKINPFAVDFAGQRARTHTLIFATGAAPRRLAVPGADRFAPPHGSGVHTCAVCDGALYRERPVAVVGGGDSAMEEALGLAMLCSSVTVVHRREEFRASKVMLDRARANKHIHWETNQIVDEVVGDPSEKPAPTLTGLRLKDVKSGAIKTLNVDGLFVAIGHVPATDLLRGQVSFDHEGYIQVNEKQETSIRGLYAAGDCHDRHYRQAVTAAGMGCIAALEAARFLARGNAE